ncbi:hypothetical protein, partial [Caminibacter sp.]
PIFFWKNYYIFTHKNTVKEILISFFIGLLISFLPKKQKLIFGLLFIALSLIQIGYFGFLRTYLPPYQIGLLFSENKDILAQHARRRNINFNYFKLCRY